MNKKHTNHHLLKINDIKTESYNMMMMHEKSKMRQIPRRCRPVGDLSSRSTFLQMRMITINLIYVPVVQGIIFS
ncbi:hypothetical protein AXN64_21600 [Salmonella enterica subsp. enterica]|nr:hypothetical protein [Salmonella enterica subsp. enterica]ECI1501131.1 hypothetical protein [Salmonella enterica subsp. enterica serovar Kentucky]EDT5584586.1 hypothetical protein [Salmonella enterica subsp. enterica serovar Choleraesuis]HAF6288973.1 hypothetical protein [Salmonella enterica]EBQ0213685.1 hypothetical protein [Salmonella enterica subsp. enterica]